LALINITVQKTIESGRYSCTLPSARGAKYGQNDLWIAATAVAADAFLLTTDKDFDYLIPSHVQGQVISAS
jgi:predicted nucleic acid-binding protein